MENIYYFPRWNVSIKREVQPSADSIFQTVHTGVSRYELFKL